MEEKEDYEFNFIENNMFYKELGECLVDFIWWLYWLGGFGGDLGSRYVFLVVRLIICIYLVLSY